LSAAAAEESGRGGFAHAHTAGQTANLHGAETAATAPRRRDRSDKASTRSYR
jgi:hypothetical protein